MAARKGTSSRRKKPSSTEDLRATAPMGTVLMVGDMKGAITFYEKLGFALQAALPRSDGELTVAFLAFGASMLLLGRRDELHYEHAARAKKIRSGPHGLGVVMTLLVSDLEKVYRAVQKAGAEILMEPADEFYGDRVFMFLDPEGYEWKISQPVKNVDEREVAATIAAS